MAKRKKKNFTLLLLVLVMIIMAGAYVGISKWNDDKEAKKTAESEAKTVATIDTSKAVKISFSNESGTMTLVNDKDIWKNQADAAFPVNQTYVASMLAAMSDIKATKTVAQKADDLGEYGLKQPSIIAEVTLEDNSIQKVTLGMEVPVAGGYYALVGEDSKVYAVDTGIYDCFKYTENQMIQMETAPAITTANITHLTVNTGDDNKNFEAVYDTEGTGASDYYLWDIKQPYKTDVSADPTQISTLLENYGSFTYNECVDYNCEDPTNYGISKDGKSIDIAYYEEKSSDTSSDTTDEDVKATDDAEKTKTTKIGKSFGLLIGNVNENGDYYVQPVGSKAVYLMSASSVETMLNINAFDYVNKSILLQNIDDVTSIDLVVEGKSHHVTITKPKSDDKEGTNTYEVDGVKMKADDFTAAYEKMVGLVLSSESKEKVTDSSPYLTVTIHTTSADKTVKFLPYDGANFYRVSADGAENFLIDKNSVEKMLTSFLNNN